MGSWSVHCNISKIAITAGDKCVLLPIKKNQYQSYQYFTWNPATLPIFGEYNDYGGLENIEITNNTKLIEEYFGASIEDFVGYFTEEVTYQREDVDITTFNKHTVEEMKDWNFMFINREVYDFMANNSFNKGHLTFGNPAILKLIGFIPHGKTTDSRYTDRWMYADKEFWSDGTWLQTPEGKSFYYFNGEEKWKNSLCSYIDIPEDKMWIGERSMTQLWKYLDDKTIKQLFMPILTAQHYDGHEDFLEELLKTIDTDKLDKKLSDKIVKDFKINSIIDVYRSSLRKFGHEFAELVTLASNLHPMSSTFEPYTCYLTPQCGEREQHQVLLDKFAEINRSKIYTEEDD